MPRPDSAHNGRLVAALRTLTQRGELVWRDEAGRYVGRLDGHETAVLAPHETAGEWRLKVRGRTIDHPQVAALFDDVDEPEQDRTRVKELDLIERGKP